MDLLGGVSAVPKSKTWVRVHVVYPLLPFFLDGVIRFFASEFSLNLCTFSPAVLAMSLALLSIFVSQSILLKTQIIPNDQDKEDILGAANQFITYAIFCIAGFCILVLLNALKEFKGFKTESITKGFSLAVYLLAIIPIINAIRAQKSFKLKAMS